MLTFIESYYLVLVFPDMLFSRPNCLCHFNLVLFSVNVDLYKVLVKELAQTLERQFAGNVESRAAGVVINTMGWIEGVGYEVLDFVFP